MFDALIMTLPGLGNVAAVVFLLFFIYSVVGVQLFAKVGGQSPTDSCFLWPGQLPSNMIMGQRKRPRNFFLRAPRSQVQYNGELGPHTNFRSFFLAFLSLLRFSTGENWNGDRPGPTSCLLCFLYRPPVSFSCLKLGGHVCSSSFDLFSFNVFI